MVYCAGLENQRSERARRFESYRLRNKNRFKMYIAPSGSSYLKRFRPDAWELIVLR